MLFNYRKYSALKYILHAAHYALKQSKTIAVHHKPKPRLR